MISIMDETFTDEKRFENEHLHRGQVRQGPAGPGDLSDLGAAEEGR
jgi:hypothetical protein